MRVFQIIPKYTPYIPYFEKKYKIQYRDLTFEELRQQVIKDRFYAVHVLKPALDNDKNAFYTIWDYPRLQIKWAREKGWNETDLKKIVFAQIEDYKPDIFYNCHPIAFGADEIRKLGVHGLLKIAWFASPEKSFIDYSVYHSRFTNFPPDIKDKSETGYRSDLFQPAYDPVMDRYAESTERTTDIFFYGNYHSWYFSSRNKFIDQLCEFKEREKLTIKIALQYHTEFHPPKPNNKLTRWLMRCFKIIDFPSAIIRKNSVRPVYGLSLYQELSKSKIVFNASVDFSGNYKANMRNFEALGCGAHMISDDGTYPDGFLKDRDFSVYSDFDDFVVKAKYFLNHTQESRQIAQQGHQTLKKTFTKEKQWEKFREIVVTL